MRVVPCSLGEIVDGAIYIILVPFAILLLIYRAVTAFLNQDVGPQTMKAAIIAAAIAMGIYAFVLAWVVPAMAILDIMKGKG